jgi:hypothetical protein
LRSGRVFASEDANAALGWRCGDTWMGGTAQSGSACSLFYSDADGEAATAQLLDFKNTELRSWQINPGSPDIEFTWPAGTSAAWIRLRQADGDQVWAAPIWLGGELP